MDNNDSDVYLTISSHQKSSIKIGVEKFWKTYKKKLVAESFPVNFWKVLRTPFLQNTSRQLLLLNVLSLTRRQCVLLWCEIFWKLTVRKSLSRTYIKQIYEKQFERLHFYLEKVPPYACFRFLFTHNYSEHPWVFILSIVCYSIR